VHVQTLYRVQRLANDVTEALLFVEVYELLQCCSSIAELVRAHDKGDVEACGITYD